MKNTYILGLHKVSKSEREKLYTTLIDAFGEYPKMRAAFSEEKSQMAALEATIRYYAAYDTHYGSAFSLDENINEAVVLVYSDDMKYTLFRHIISGSYSKQYRAAMNKLSKSDRNRRIQLFNELDRLETTVDIPRPHIYLDFLGVKSDCQHQGRGRKLMTSVCSFADSMQLPIMLFTNTDEDVAFYQSLGFNIIGITSSEEFKFINTYMLYEPVDDPK